MKISLEIAEGIYRIGALEPGQVTLERGGQDGTVEERVIQRSSFMLSPDQLLPNWAPTHIDQVGVAELEPALELAPTLVLLGTGSQAVLPDMALMQLFMSRGIGFETMQTAAACRTFNLLAYEGRRMLKMIQHGSPLIYYLKQSMIPSLRVF